jgi:hypothetical protein
MRLRNEAEFLARKLELYRDVKGWIQDEESSSAELASLFQTAQRTLQSAHGKLDAKLAEVDAMHKASVAVVRTDALLAESDFLTDIQSVLGDQQIETP